MLSFCVVRGVLSSSSGLGPLGDTCSAISFLVVALLLRSACYRTGIGRTDRVSVMLF